ncbi:hypothetical protein COP1_030987 [Malus domestica]
MVEVQVRKLYCVSKAAILPISIEDAAWSDVEIEKAGETLVRVNQDTHLNNRVLDLRTLAIRGYSAFRVKLAISLGSS